MQEPGIEESGMDKSGMNQSGMDQSGRERVVIFATESREVAGQPGVDEMGTGETQNAARPNNIPPSHPPYTVGADLPHEGPPVAYCQQCGMGLTATSMRQVGSGIFCKPCATGRQAQDTGWAPVPIADSVPSDTPPATAPNPVLAGWLGLIPGVGAMYNGQYAKSVVHLVIFVVLLSLGDNLNWVFYWFVWGWIFYQGFEAYHTALARRNGLPLPNPFGLNDLADRLGFFPSGVFGREQVRPMPPPSPTGYASHTGPFRAQAASQYASPTSPTTPSPSGSFTAAAGGPGSASSPFVAPGFAGASNPSGVPGTAASAQQASAAGAAPYTPTFTGVPPAQPAPINPLSHAARFPGGAVWLIGLGALFLLGNILPSWRVDGRWLVPILLAGIALWVGSRRVVALRDTQPLFPLSGARPDFAAVLVGPVLLLTVAVLLALQDAHVIPLRHSWPALLIFWGALLLLSRARQLSPETYGAPVGTSSEPNAAAPSAEGMSPR